MNAYTNLGAVPALAKRSAEKRDALLKRTGPAARAILREIKRLPRGQRAAELNRALAEFDPTLPSRMRFVAERLHREKMPVDVAVERALALSLADSTIEQIKQLGMRARAGMQMPVGALGCVGCPTGMGGLGDAGKVIKNMARGVSCSTELRDSVAELVGRKEGRDAHDATVIGFNFSAAMAQCPTGTSAEEDVYVEETEKPSLLIPVVVGVGVLAAVGGIVMMARKKK